MYSCALHPLAGPIPADGLAPVLCFLLSVVLVMHQCQEACALSVAAAGACLAKFGLSRVVLCCAPRPPCLPPAKVPAPPAVSRNASWLDLFFFLYGGPCPVSEVIAGWTKQRPGAVRMHAPGQPVALVWDGTVLSFSHSAWDVDPSSSRRSCCSELFTSRATRPLTGRRLGAWLGHYSFLPLPALTRTRTVPPTR